MRSTLAFLAALSLAAPAQAQTDPEEHTLRFESESVPLGVYVGNLHVCHTPCSHDLPAGARVRLFFAPESAAEHTSVQHRATEHQPIAFGDYDVLGPRTLRLRWVDRSEIRLAGDVVLIAGVTLGALVGGTAIASYGGTDDSLFVLGIAGLIVMGASLLVGLPLSFYEDGIELVE